MAVDIIHKLTVYKLNNDTLNTATIPSYKMVAETIWNESNKNYPYRLFFHKRGPFTAPWMAVFAPLQLNVPQIDLPQNIVSGFILLIQIETSVYAITGGVGHISSPQASID